MANRAAFFRESDLTKALRAVRKAGDSYNRVEIDPVSGRIIMTKETVVPAADPFDSWKAKRDARPS